MRPKSGSPVIAMLPSSLTSELPKCTATGSPSPSMSSVSVVAILADLDPSMLPSVTCITPGPHDGWPSGITFSVEPWAVWQLRYPSSMSNESASGGCGAVDADSFAIVRSVHMSSSRWMSACPTGAGRERSMVTGPMVMPCRKRDSGPSEGGSAASNSGMSMAATPGQTCKSSQVKSSQLVRR